MPGEPTLTKGGTVFLACSYLLVNILYSPAVKRQKRSRDTPDCVHPSGARNNTEEQAKEHPTDDDSIKIQQTQHEIAMF